MNKMITSSIMLLLTSATQLFAQPPHGPKPIIVWLHKYDWDSAVESLRRNTNSIGEVSPAWYEVRSDSFLHPISGVPVDSPDIFSITTSGRVTLRPLVSNVSADGTHPEYVRPLFTDMKLRQAHIASLQKLVVDHRYDGLDIDYEGFRMPELLDLANFIEDIAVSLHSVGKTLAVSIEVQSSDDCLPAWQQIGRVADSVRLMTYGQTKLSPGPLVDLGWVKSNVQRALKAIPQNKLAQGIAIYGLEWSGTTRGSGTWEYYSGIASRENATLHRDPDTSTLWYTTGTKTVWYEDRQSIKLKINIGESLGLNHFAFWRLGGEDPNIFPIGVLYPPTPYKKTK